MPVIDTSPAGRVFVEHGLFDPQSFAPAAPAVARGTRPVTFVARLQTTYGPYPYGTLAPIIGIPAIVGTASVMATPWDRAGYRRGTTINARATSQVLPVAPMPSISGG